MGANNWVQIYEGNVHPFVVTGNDTTMYVWASRMVHGVGGSLGFLCDNGERTEEVLIVAAGHWSVAHRVTDELVRKNLETTKERVLVVNPPDWAFEMLA